MKTRRQDVILEIISSQNIETQSQLNQALAERGITCAQATLSRDIRELQIVKVRGRDGRYHYTTAERPDEQDIKRKFRAIMKESVESFALAQNLLVIKTLPGLAVPVCFSMENSHIEKLVGAIAGNDTVFLVLKDNDAALALHKEMEKIIYSG